MTKEEFEQKLEVERTSRIALVNKITELEEENTELKDQLTKAKKLLQFVSEYQDMTCYADELKEIEQFLNSEVEK